MMSVLSASVMGMFGGRFSAISAAGLIGDQGGGLGDLECLFLDCSSDIAFEFVCGRPAVQRNTPMVDMSW